MSDGQQYYKVPVKMTCGGCSGAVDRVLKKAEEKQEGVLEHKIRMETVNEDKVGDVYVTGSISLDDLEAKLKKTGKQVFPGESIAEAVYLSSTAAL